MIEQDYNKLTLTFPSKEAATQAKQWIEVAVLPWLAMVSQPASVTFGPPSEPSPAMEPAQATEPIRSHHVVLTDERLDQLYQQRQSGQTSRQRLLRAQATLRDGVLPFSRPGAEPPPPSGQESPRMRAEREGGFADGEAPQPSARKGSRLRPAPPAPTPSSPRP
jgi:hypothetical protein